MFRLFVFTFSLMAATAAWGQTTYDPKIAYTQLSGKTTYVYVANADGTGAWRLVPGVNGVSGVDFAPGGGRIAFSDSQGLKVVTYTAGNTGIQVNGVQLLVNLVNGRPGPPDFSPDGTRIIYQTSSKTSPNTIRAVTVPGGVEVLSYPCYLCSEPRWLRSELGDAFAFRRWDFSGPSLIPEIWTALVEQDGTVTAGLVLSAANQAFGGIEDFDVARTRDALLVTANYPTAVRFVEFDMGADFGAITDKGGSGYRGHYSADDARIIYREQVKGGYFINSLDPATGVSKRLTAKGNYGFIDARP